MAWFCVRFIAAATVSAALLAPAAFLGTALAVEPGAPERLITPLDAARVAIRERLEVKGKGAVAVTRADREALLSHYASHGSLLWVDENGPNSSLREAATTIAAADEWGLDARDYRLPDVEAPPAASLRPAQWLAETELAMTLAAYAYARHAQAGRVTPSSLSPNLDLNPEIPDFAAVLAGLHANRADIGRFLASFHPKHPQFIALKELLAEIRQKKSVEEPRTVRIPDGPSLKPGARHPHVALIRARLNAPVEADGDAELYDDVLAKAVVAYQKKNGLASNGVIGPATRGALNGAAPVRDARLVLINMERWRWMARELGEDHIHLNIPEFMFRLVRGGGVVHEERVVVGKTVTQTPILSDEMETVVLNPYWHVPESIRTNEILPILQRNPAYLERNNLQVFLAGRKQPLDPYATDWAYVDPRKIAIRQPPGDDNALGKVKFLFPNKHAVYMHDTPTKHLFNQTVRAYSHGCMRVRNPLRLAELLLEEQGWTPQRIKNTLSLGVEQHVALKRKVPVHITYFTAWVAPDGQLRAFRDLYGHDATLRAALRL